MIEHEKSNFHVQKYDNGKVTLIVNVASKCGYTDQYAELVELQERYKDDLQVRIEINWIRKRTEPSTGLELADIH